MEIEELEEFETVLDPFEYLKDYSGLNLFFRLEHLIRSGWISREKLGEQEFVSLVELAISPEAKGTHYW